MRINTIEKPNAKSFGKGCLVPMNGGLYVSRKATSSMPQDNHEDWEVFLAQKASGGRDTIVNTILTRLDALEKTNP